MRDATEIARAIASAVAWAEQSGIAMWQGSLRSPGTLAAPVCETQPIRLTAASGLRLSLALVISGCGRLDLTDGSQGGIQHQKQAPSNQQVSTVRDFL